MLRKERSLPKALFLQICSYLNPEQIILLAVASKELMILSKDNHFWFQLYRNEKAPESAFNSGIIYRNIFFKTIKKLPFSEAKYFGENPPQLNRVFFDERFGLYDTKDSQQSVVFTVLKDAQKNICLFIEFQQGKNLYMLKIFSKNKYLKAEYITQANANASNYLSSDHASTSSYVNLKELENVINNLLNTPIKTTMTEWIKIFLIQADASLSPETGERHDVLLKLLDKLNENTESVHRCIIC